MSQTNLAKAVLGAALVAGLAGVTYRQYQKSKPNATTVTASSLAAGASKCSISTRTDSATGIKLFELTNSSGSSATVLDVGATLYSMRVPDRNGRFADVVLAHADLKTYLTPPAGNPYLGNTIGRYGNRIDSGRFKLDGEWVQVTKNYANGQHILHGGSTAGAFHTQTFVRTESRTESDRVSIRLQHVSPDGSEGFPGTVTCDVEYTLTDRNELIIDMYGSTADKKTVLSLCNHAYWNLSGDTSGATVTSHELKLEADTRTELATEFLIPTGTILSVKGTADSKGDSKSTALANCVYDFTAAKLIGRDIAFFKGDKATGGGYDLNYVIRRPPAAAAPAADTKKPDLPLVLAATVVDPASGRVMSVHTNAPGIQFYTANWLGGTAGKDGVTYKQHSGVCLETQHFPDAPNHPNFPSAALAPGEVYHNRAVHAFGVQK